MWLLVLAPLLLPTLCLSAALNEDGSARWQKTIINCVTKTNENDSSVTCLFDFDVAQKDKEYDFNVITIDPASNREDVVLMCNWIIKGQPPECKIDEGYRFDNTNINDKTSLFVPPQVMNSGYKFQCQILPPDPNRPSKPCDKNTTCKEGVHINDTTTTESTTVPSTTTQTVTTAIPETIVDASQSLTRLEIITIVSVLLGVAFLAGVIIVVAVCMYRKLKSRRPESADPATETLVPLPPADSNSGIQARPRYHREHSVQHRVNKYIEAALEHFRKKKEDATTANKELFMQVSRHPSMSRIVRVLESKDPDMETLRKVLESEDPDMETLRKVLKSLDPAMDTFLRNILHEIKKDGTTNNNKETLYDTTLLKETVV